MWLRLALVLAVVGVLTACSVEASHLVSSAHVQSQGSSAELSGSPITSPTAQAGVRSPAPTSVPPRSDAGQLEAAGAHSAELEPLEPVPVANMIYFIDASDEGTTLFTISASGGDVKRVAQIGSGTDINLSPDGNSIVTSEYQPADPGQIGELDLAIVNLGDRSRTELTTAPGNELDAVWSADGKWLLYRQTDGEDAGLRIASPTEHTSVLAIPESELSPQWSEQAHLWGGTVETIIYRSTEEELVVASAEGDKVIASMNRAAEISVHPAATHVAFVAEAPERSRFFDSDLRVVSTSGGNEALLSDLPGNKHSISWSPDGAWIAFLNEQDGAETPRNALFVVSADGSVVHELEAARPNLFMSKPVWSPYSDSVVTGATIDGVNELVLYDLNGEITPLGVSGLPLSWR